ncbi:ribosome small subunit-dependent GTPase A [Thermotoga sp. KOL6]|uniref:ribosome small subunit-dependent GTPase A n=1 Tax=Thermotoga sp. KOL6 TaxID=126741 RepID=UPI000C75766A|nr:ribosome small subunit-dependent GTPase A [Thermotoga sp. KOL6]PLV60101.1 ribosome biogenesis GTPase RsgA [Thermotoga sp. KOL6]
MRRTGVVVSFHSNMVTVEDEKTGERLLCKLRGKFRLQNLKIYVGDRVEYTPDGTGSGVIENVFHRKNLLDKPHVANVDQVILVVTVKMPETPTYIIDKFLVLAEKNSLDTIIVINKMDLYDSEDLKKVEELYKVYSILYPIVKTSARTGLGIDELKGYLKGKISTMAGLSGVGKSSLLNAINPGLKLRVSDVSQKLKRGRHTTTSAQLLKFDFGGYVVDTPGFANLEISDIPANELKYYFKEFESRQCFFSDCNHVDEPGCGVKEAMETGEIARSRYENYVKMFYEILGRGKK